MKERYKIKETIKERSSGGHVYLGIDQETEKECIIKSFPFSSIKDIQEFDRLEKETKILTHIKHPNIPGFIEAFNEKSDGDSFLYLVQEYIKGESLDNLILSGKHFREKDLIILLITFVPVLQYLHSFSPAIIHRNIKPSNILLSEDNQLYLLDFDSVKSSNKNSQDPAYPAESYGYIPKELFEGKGVKASDIYSLGATSIYMLSHMEPSEMEDPDGRIDFKPHVNISEKFSSIIEKMIEPDLSNRFTDGDELLKALNSLSEPSSKIENMDNLFNGGSEEVVIELDGNSGFNNIDDLNLPGEIEKQLQSFMNDGFMSDTKGKVVKRTVTYKSGSFVSGEDISDDFFSDSSFELKKNGTVSKSQSITTTIKGKSVNKDNSSLNKIDDSPFFIIFMGFLFVFCILIFILGFLL